MNFRENSMAILHYQPYEKLPVVHFGFWIETLQKWYEEGHITEYEATHWGDGNEADQSIGKKLGFDFNWYSTYSPATGLKPAFERKILEYLPDDHVKVVDRAGVVVIEKLNTPSIPSEVDHLLKDRESWEKYYKEKLQYSDDRLNYEWLESLRDVNKRETPLGLFCGSLFGEIRNWLGVEGASYLYADDEDLYAEIIDTVGNLCYQTTKKALESGVTFDFGHFWEDICFKNGPLVIPSVFEELVGPHYRRITQLLNQHGVDIVSLDCDGCIDTLVPIWLENGVNTMFPIEVGVWNGNIAPWREQYGKKIRGVGGMNKVVFSRDYAAVEEEIERLKPLVELGGYIPCPDHRIAPDAKWENVQYYCEKMKETFGK